jgi:DNA ligase (NAD+)
MSQRDIQDLVEQLQQAQDAYYNGDPVMSDAEFDALEDELRGRAPKNAYFKRVGSGMVRSPADLYGLDEAKLAALTLSGKKVGDSTAKRVMKNLRAKMELRIADFVGSLGIDMWGRSMTQFIVDAGLDTLEKMEDATVAQISAIPGVGDTKAVKFVEGFRRSRKMIDELLAAGVEVKKPITGGKLSGVSFCFTGVRDPAFADDLLEAGGTVKNSVGKGLTYLVAKDPKSNSGKAKKARAQGTEVISLEEAKALL